MRDLLGSAGFSDIRIESVIEPVRTGSDADDSAEFLWSIPATQRCSGSLYLPGTSPQALRIAETLQGTHTKAELTTRPQGDSAIAQGVALTGSVLVLDGQEDDHYCTDNAVGAPVHIAPVCISQAAFRAYERALFANARLTTYLAGHTGHATELHESAPYTNQLILLWVAVSAVSAPQPQ